MKIKFKLLGVILIFMTAFFYQVSVINKSILYESGLNFEEVISMIVLFFILICALLWIYIRKLEAKLKFKNNEFHIQNKWINSILSNIGDGVIIADEKGRVTFVNQIAQNVMEISKDEWIGMPLDKVIDVINAKMNNNVNDSINHWGETNIEAEQNHIPELCCGKDNCINSLTTPIYNKNGKVIGSVLVIPSISECDRAGQIIHKMAYYDALTGLANRALINNTLSKKIDAAKERKDRLALLFVDLDNFKSINDTLGHDTGDYLLKHVGRIIKDCIEEGSVAGRLGGDEFIIISNNVESIDRVIEVAEQVRKAFNGPMYLNDREFYVTASIGIALYPDHGNDAKILLKNADTAMYAAKEMGKNNFQLYNDEMISKITEKLEMENSLRNAIKNEEFTLFYQPQIDINSGKVIGMEALIRWIHPVKGIISPATFIPLAEETGLILPIGEWVLYSACKQNKLWQEMGYAPMRVAVNLSIRQFEQESIVETVKQVLEKTGLSPKWLELEITEGIAIKCFECSTKRIKQLKEIGIHVSLDDFGTGYSSLNYLKRLPIDTLKIDKSFLDNIELDQEEEYITKAMINLAHSMKLDVIAEGVETEKQLEFLRYQGCDKAQGYLFSKPMPVGEFEELLK